LDTYTRLRELTGGLTAYLAVYGCQQNQADGDRLRGSLLAMGYRLTQDHTEADLLVLVTCAVRKHAETKLLGHLGEYLRTGKPGVKAVLCGCMAQREEVRELLRTSYRQVALTFGPADIGRFPEYMLTLLTEGGRRLYASPDTAPIGEDIPLARLPEDGRANVTIMTGCDNFCSYCIVPYVRGRERSRAPEAVLEEVRGLVAGGVREIWLLGQNVNSYRPDFSELLRACGSFDGDYTVRFMTSHPRDAGRRLFSAIAETPRVAPILHLPVQSGSNAVLKAMNRGYTREEYLEKIRLAKELIPRVALTSDVIVGFPGETERDFLDTLDLLKEVGFAKLFTFQYSPRSGTPAAELPQTLTPEEMKERFLRLLALQKEIERRGGVIPPAG
jgi:tRNA-2-methylthio-N6-dimethylallyladenosine synthase